jgi:hypothetical protein
MKPSQKIDIWVQKTKSDGTTESYGKTTYDFKFKGAKVLSVFNNGIRIKLKSGQILVGTPTNDGDIGWTQYIDESDPLLIEKRKKEENEQLERYYQEHPEGGPISIIHPNCRCHITESDAE